MFHSSTDQISKKYSKDEIEKRLLAILDKKDNYSQFIKSVYPKEITAQTKQPSVITKPVGDFKETLSVVVD
ncbi:MAG: hypothetical protein WCL18_00210 [bacterium]